MMILIVGATGATGRLLVEELLNRGQQVKVIVRSANSLPDSINDHDNLSVTEANVHELTDHEISCHIEGCDAIASCLGHNLTFKGMFGPPRLLVTDTARRLCGAVIAHKPDKMVKFILMNTTGNSNQDIPETISFAEKCVIWLLRLLLPPHVDNEKAAEYLRTEIGQSNESIEWAAVRPDSLTNESEVSAYNVHPSPIRSAIFDAGLTSRINVSHFITELILDKHTWIKWKGQMPVIYNQESDSSKS